ncbi:MAG: SUMF1/EgtB/PvdO family nonheme iron enzyme [Spirochaetota bacterium]|nr:SUMF1/EgtB/PvdO family nonheme iron enzyme [Spirochaetota bacterium]
MKRLLKLLVIVTISASFCSCGDDNDATVSGYVVRPEKDPTLTLTSISEDDSILVFEGSQTALDSISSNKILMFGVTDLTPYGLLRKVETVTSDGSQAIVETTQATLTDAIEEGTIKAQKSLSTDDIIESKHKDGVILVTHPLDKHTGGFEGEASFVYNISNVEIYDQIYINGYIAFNSEIDFEVDIGFWAINKISFVNTTDITSELTLSTNISTYDIHKKVEIARLTLAPIPTTVPGVVITPIITINVGFDGIASAGIETGLTECTNITSGLIYEYGYWAPIANYSFDFEYIPPELNAECHFKGYAGPQLNLLINKIAGPYGNIEGYLEFDAGYSDYLWWELYGGLECSLGIRGEIFGNEFFDYEHPQPLIDYRKLIAQSSKPNNEPVLSNIMVSPPSGDTTTNFTFTVHYYDEDGDSPPTRYVNIDGINYTMSLSSGNSSDGDYSYTTQLSEGNHSYYFLFSDGEVVVRLPAVSGTYSGPDVDEILIDMVYVPGGTFQMGCDDLFGDNFSTPEHQVTLSSFYMGKYEVTNAQVVNVFNWANANGKFASVSDITVTNTGDSHELLDLDDVHCNIEYIGGTFSVETGRGDDGYGGSVDLSNYPCIFISWYGAAAFCNYLSEMEGLTPCYDLSDWSCNFSNNGYRLPTEAEWEYTARYIDGISWLPGNHASGDESGYCTPIDGNESTVFGDYAWYWDNSGTTPHSDVYNSRGTHEVGTAAENHLGLYDMSGNVLEWCNDWYMNYTSSSKINPTGPVHGDYRVIRGGNWNCDEYYLRVSERGDGHFASPHSMRSIRGLRIAKVD